MGEPQLLAPPYGTRGSPSIFNQAQIVHKITPMHRGWANRVLRLIWDIWKPIEHEVNTIITIPLTNHLGILVIRVHHPHQSQVPLSGLAYNFVYHIRSPQRLRPTRTEWIFGSLGGRRLRVFRGIIHRRFGVGSFLT